MRDQGLLCVHSPLPPHSGEEYPHERRTEIWSPFRHLARHLWVGGATRLLRWGATDEEFARPYPGAELIPGRNAQRHLCGDHRCASGACFGRGSCRWGPDRGGWYSWDRLDNWGRKSADRVHPEWQSIKVGDRFIGMPDGSQWWEVAAVEPERFLALRASIDLRGHPFDPHGPRPRYFTDSTWCWVLEPICRVAALASLRAAPRRSSLVALQQSVSTLFIEAGTLGHADALVREFEEIG